MQDDLPEPDWPTSAMVCPLDTVKLTPFNTFTAGRVGYASSTSSNEIVLGNLSSLTPLSLSSGSAADVRSMVPNTLDATARVSRTILMGSAAPPTLMAPMSTAKKAVKTSPVEPMPSSTSVDPYHRAIACTRYMMAVDAARPKAAKVPDFFDDAVARSTISSCSATSLGAPPKAMTIRMAERTSSANETASANCSWPARDALAIRMPKKAPMPARRGDVPTSTRPRRHDLMNPMTKPATKVASTCRVVGILSPMASWMRSMSLLTWAARAPSSYES
mmetsp:Transcript_15994/g.49975  ORF Transcript_15994/g.49975 Transcript_15994/m.49975 type:complete len:276 (-) Transcript_15994:71-898(-)